MKVSIELEELSKKTLIRIALETTDSNVLDELATNRSSKILEAVAGNEYARRETIISLSKSKFEEVRRKALKSLNLT